MSIDTEVTSNTVGEDPNNEKEDIVVRCERNPDEFYLVKVSTRKSIEFDWSLYITAMCQAYIVQPTLRLLDNSIVFGAVDQQIE